MMATEKQMAYLKQLVKEVENQGGEVPEYIEWGLNDGHIPTNVASEMIDDLKQLLGRD